MNRIAELRRQKNLTQRQMGAIIGCSHGAISNYETESRALDPATISKLCDYFDVTADYLLCRSAVPKQVFTEEEASLIAAYRSADTRARDMVNLALEPFRKKANEGVS